jgi:hypothetical protein
MQVALQATMAVTQSLDPLLQMAVEVPDLR